MAKGVRGRYTNKKVTIQHQASMRCTRQGLQRKDAKTQRYFGICLRRPGVTILIVYASGGRATSGFIDSQLTEINIMTFYRLPTAGSIYNKYLVT